MPLGLAGMIALVLLAVDPFGPRSVPSPLSEATATGAPSDAGDAGDAGAPRDDASVPPTPEDSDPYAEPETYEGPWRRWPLPRWCVYNQRPCRTAGGAPGLQCGGDTECWNPCPPGKAPRGFYCARTCRTNADCRGGKCMLNEPECPGGGCDTGLCDGWPNLEGCTEPCSLPSGDSGVRCGKRCVSPCPRGFFPYGGTHCVKRCKSAADCNGKDVCSTDDGRNYFCGGLCPTESCPYPYD